MTFFKKLLVAAAAWETGAALLRHSNRASTFALAQARAQALGRPLVVVGDPGGGGWTKLFPAYGCGDVCVDLHGCACPNQIEADLSKPVPGLADDSSVVFVSCVYEYIDDLPAAWAETKRIAGSVDNIFIVTVQRWTLASFMFPGARWTIAQAPPSCPVLAAHRISGLFAGDGNFMGV